jgi:hypothetical protein
MSLLHSLLSSSRTSENFSINIGNHSPLIFLHHPIVQTALIMISEETSKKKKFFFFIWTSENCCKISRANLEVMIFDFSFLFSEINCSVVDASIDMILFCYLFVHPHLSVEYFLIASLRFSFQSVRWNNDSYLRKYQIRLRKYYFRSKKKDV